MIRTFLLLVCAVVLGAAASAHQQRLATAEVLFNARSGFIEVAHRYALHDAEHAVAEIEGQRPDLLGDGDAQAAFAAYVSDRFSMRGPDGSLIALELLGVEIAGGHIWIYQQAPWSGDPKPIEMRNGALHEIWADHRSLVTVRRGDENASLVFEDDQFLPLVFEPTD